MRAVCSRFFPNQLRAFGALKSRPDPVKNWDINASKLCAVDTRKHNETCLRKIIEEESVIHLGDLAFRRTTLWEEPAALMNIVIWASAWNVGTLHVMLRENPISVDHEGGKYRCT